MRPYPASPSGMPGVQTLVPVMLTHVNDGKLTLQRFVELTSAGPQRVLLLGDLINGDSTADFVTDNQQRVAVRAVAGRHKLYTLRA